MSRSSWSTELESSRRLILGWLGGALGASLAPVWAAQTEVWLVLSEAGGVHLDAAQALQAAWERDPRLLLTWRIGRWQELPPLSAEAIPSLIITLGQSAWRGAVERVLNQPALARLPLLAALLPQSSYRELAAKAALRSTAVLLDQPPARYVELLQLALPGYKRIGVLFGPDSIAARAELARALAARGLTLLQATVLSDANSLYPVLRTLLDEADVLLALPDRLVFNPVTIPNILIAAYRQRVPLISYSAAHVRAGALLALHTSANDAAEQIAAVMRQTLAGHSLPPPRMAQGCSVTINEQVARSLDLVLPDPVALARTLQRESVS